LAGCSQVLGALRAELLMQWRRPGFWIAYGCVTGLLILLTLQGAIPLRALPPDSIYVQKHYTAEHLAHLLVWNAMMYGAMFFGIMAAFLVVDRLEREKRLGTWQLQRTSVGGCGRYVLGKIGGNMLAVLLPALVAVQLCALAAVLVGWPAKLQLQFLEASCLVLIPSMLAAVAVTFLLASLLPVRIVQVAFSLLWLELNIGTGWYGLVFSPFNPSGMLVLPIFFPTPPTTYVDPTFKPSMELALLNIGTLLLTTLVALCLTYGSLVMQQRREERA